MKIRNLILIVSFVLAAERAPCGDVVRPRWAIMYEDLNSKTVEKISYSDTPLTDVLSNLQERKIIGASVTMVGGEGKNISLNVEKKSALEILRLICNQSSMYFTLENHRIVIKPEPGSATEIIEFVIPDARMHAELELRIGRSIGLDKLYSAAWISEKGTFLLKVAAVESEGARKAMSFLGFEEKGDDEIFK